jgi:hypothetical protein
MDAGTNLGGHHRCHAATIATVKKPEAHSGGLRESENCIFSIPSDAPRDSEAEIFSETFFVFIRVIRG